MDTAVLDSLENSDAMDFVEMKPDNTNRTHAEAAQSAVQFLTKSESDTTHSDDADMEDDNQPDDSVVDMEEEKVTKQSGPPSKKVTKQSGPPSNIADAEDYDFSSL